jgi:acetylornithine deacetylase
MTSTSLLKDELQGLFLEKDEYISLLERLIGETKHLQNNPRQGLVPKEECVAQHVLNELQPHSQESGGGPLLIETPTFVPGRPNLIISYPGLEETCTGLVGAHFDVVPANPESWERDPFSLIVEGDKLYGRGTTDCLGHVAMITLLLQHLAKRQPKLKRSVVAVFIAGEEGGEAGVGIDMLVQHGMLNQLKHDCTCYWIDAADSQPCTGTAGALQWHLKATGRVFHSGLPHLGINSLELASEAMAIIQKRFYEDFPPRPEEELYKYGTPSTMKPTQVSCSPGALNQLPAWTEFSGDVRLTPFYDPVDVMNKVQEYIDEINENIEHVPTRGPCSKYTLEGEDVDVKRGIVEITWTDDKESVRQMEGIACNLDSPGLKALIDATAQVRGEAKPYSITGSLPLVREMQNAGFDIQITGFGLSKTYHADNEYCLLSDMQDAFQILLRVISINDEQ